MDLLNLIIRTFKEMPIVATIATVLFVGWITLIVIGVRAIKRKF